MAVIALYGAKGGTGRTTVAAMSALALLQKGHNVRLLNTSTIDELNPLEKWSDELARSGMPYASRFSFKNYANEEEPTFKDIARLDNGSDITIIDTGRCDTPLRQMAFATANLIIMPYTGNLDNNTGAQYAPKFLPDHTKTVALKTRSSGDLPVEEQNDIPILPLALLDCSDFSLFSDSERKLRQNSSNDSPDTLETSGPTFTLSKLGQVLLDNLAVPTEQYTNSWAKQTTGEHLRLVWPPQNETSKD